MPSPRSARRAGPAAEGAAIELGAYFTRIGYRDGDTERTRFDTAAQVVATLTGRFGIDISGLGGAEARVAEVLDS